MADINTLARKCGVSKATVSRVFTGRARVSDEIRARVLAAARELNYRPPQVMARDCVAIVINEMPNPARRTSFTERLLNSAVFEVTRRNLLTEILPVKDLPKLYNGYTKAVLLLLSEQVIEQHFEQLRALSMPILTVNKQYDFSSAVCTDHGEGVRLALEHLHANGHRRIAVTVDQFFNQAGRERLDAYRAFLAAHGLPELEPVMYTDLEPEGSNHRLLQLLKQQPTALIACGEGVALPVLHELRHLGVRIPEDLSLITSELSGISGWMTPELTTIDQELDQLAAATVAELVKLIRHPDTPKGVHWLHTHLIVRNSVRNPA